MEHAEECHQEENLRIAVNIEMFETLVQGHLEECDEDVGSGSGREDEGQERAEAAIEDGGSNISQGLYSSLVSIPSLLQEVMDDVRTVVHTEADCNDQVDAGDCVDRQAPEMDESADVDESDEDTGEDKNTGGEVLDQNKSGQEDAEKRETEVPPELQLDDLVRLPAGVLGPHWESSIGKVGLCHDLLYFVHCRDPFRWSMEQFVSQLDGGKLDQWNVLRFKLKVRRYHNVRSCLTADQFVHEVKVSSVLRA